MVIFLHNNHLSKIFSSFFKFLMMNCETNVCTCFASANIVLSPGFSTIGQKSCPQRGAWAWAFPLRCFAAFFHLTYAYAPGFARCGAKLRFSLSNPPFFILQIKNCPQRGQGHFRFAPMLMPISLSNPPFFILQIKNCPQRGQAP